ncbi:NAD(P)/FAD-dependent oxidoreductase [Streptomyces radicis]|uniref:FAD-binding oxidoreductase n=1 Tax=Streptomyces radicis TaxID=1750517 RepID=A0A3A9WCP7_9ACTN|nr:FAD-binding oxidoreductase [Streptomyces radicis]RKN10432.1 FAD-binding oxidoreductase [Streptomyces radicis]RKN24691.1 FAD-binding oxidoreductase [Streptomyces radicis]
MAVVVVGAGIVGASVAYHLARRGVAVTLVERDARPAAGVTGLSFAWIGNAGGEWPGGAEDLRGPVLDDHRRLEAELPGVAVRWTGSLRWGDGHLGGNVVGRKEIRALEPRLRTPPEWAAHIPSDGGVDAPALTEALVRGARALGARVLLGTPVTALSVERGRVTGVVTPAGCHTATTVVLAAGTGSAALGAPLGVALPVAASPAFLLRLAAPPGLVNGVVATPEFEVREVADGCLLMTLPPEGERAGERLARHGVRLLREAFLGAEPCHVVGYGVGARPLPERGPLLGPLTPDGSLYAAVLHPGVTLAPTVGRLVAHELATGEPVAELRRCRPRVAGLG